MSNPVTIEANTVVPAAQGQYFKIYTVDPDVTEFTVTDQATGRALDVTNGAFMTISDAGFTVSADCYIIPFVDAPALIIGGGGGSTSGSTLVVDYMPNLPQSAVPGDLAFVEDTQELLIWNGSDWVPATPETSATSDCNVTITARDGIECGTYATTNGSGGCIAIGYKAYAKEQANNNYTTTETGNPWTSFNTSNNWTSVAYGANASAVSRGVAVGGLAKAGNQSNINYRGNTAVGFNATAGVSADGATASGSYATASGSSATASGSSATASGSSATASGSYATASGSYATASGYASTAIGSYATASGYYATASGSSATASGSSATASGYSATASGSYATASGYSATASGSNATASGSSATASGSNATASGYSATASGSNATASGYYATASGSSATASGSYATASGYASTAIGAHCVNGDDGSTAMLIGFDAPTPENNYGGKIYQMWFFVKDGKPHVGFAKLNRNIEECSTDMDIDESYAIDLSLLPHVQWEPNTEIDAGGGSGGC